MLSQRQKFIDSLKKKFEKNIQMVREQELDFPVEQESSMFLKLEGESERMMMNVQSILESKKQIEETLFSFKDNEETIDQEFILPQKMTKYTMEEPLEDFEESSGSYDEIFLKKNDLKNLDSQLSNSEDSFADEDQAEQEKFFKEYLKQRISVKIDNLLQHADSSKILDTVKESSNEQSEFSRRSKYLQGLKSFMLKMEETSVLQSPNCIQKKGSRFNDIVTMKSLDVKDKRRSLLLMMDSVFDKIARKDKGQKINRKISKSVNVSFNEESSEDERTTEYEEELMNKMNEALKIKTISQRQCCEKLETLIKNKVDQNFIEKVQKYSREDLKKIKKIQRFFL